MGTSLYDQYLAETGGPTKPPLSFPAPPPIAAPDVTPRPPAEPPSEPFVQKVARVNKAVQKALPLTGPIEQLETGAKKAAGAAGVAGAAALQQGGDDKNKGGDLYKQFQAEQQKQEPQSLYEQYQAEQEAAKPKPSIWDRLKSINAGVRQALVPDALQQLETGAQKFGKDQGEWGVQLAKDLAYISDPKNLPDPSKPSPPEMRAAERRVLAAIATIAMPAALHKYAAELLAARGIRPPAGPPPGSPPVSPAAAGERAPWDRSATAPPPVDQPQPLRPEQQVLRNRLATEGINPSGAIKRRPTLAPPPVEPPPEAQTFSTKGAVRRPASATAQEYVPSTDPRSAEPEHARVRAIAQSLKTSPTPEAIAEAAQQMVPRVPKGAIVVPMPGHEGASPGIHALADAIAGKVEGAEMVPALERHTPVASSTELRRAGQPGVPLEQHVASMRATTSLPPDRPVVLIDNVETTANTGKAAQEVLGRPDAKLVTYAKAPVPSTETAPIERRSENVPDRVVWSPEERARYITASQKEYAAKINKPWSQWTPEEKVGYFADQARVRAGAPWQQEVAAARQIVGDQEFSRRSIAAARQLPPEQKLEAIKQTAHEIVAGAETAHFPPEPKPGDITPVVSSNSEFAARPGVMRAVNKGEQPASLNSPLRLPEPTPEDRAIVQPKGVKEISPEEVAARKPPEPVVESTPKVPQPATVDENGLFFEHRTPGGELRDFRRVSTEGLIKAHREMQDQIQRDQQLAIYRSVENENMSGTGDRTVFTASTRTARGTSQQAEAAERLRNYGKVMDRLDAELKNRGMSSEDVYNAIQQQEEHEAAIEQEAIHHADMEDEAGTAFDFGDEEGKLESRAEPSSAQKPKKEGSAPPISDVLNVAKLNLGSKTAEQRMAAKLEEFRAQRDANKQTFSEADVNRNEILNELRAGDPLALPTEKAKKLSGEQLLARRDLVRENDQTIASLSKQMEAGMPPEAYSQAAALVQRAVEHNDALLSDLVTGSSQKGRDLNLLRRMANNSLDPAVWRVQAKRMLGDRPLTAEIDAAIRKLAQEAEDACQ